MIWLTENLWNLIVGGGVLLLAALCVRNLLPGKRGGCGGSCAGCGGSCAGCGGCANAKKCPHSGRKP